MPISVGAVTSYQDKTVAAATSYQYEAIAANGGGSSPVSAAFTISSLPAALAVPTGLFVNLVTSNEIDLSWTASTGATGYSVKRSSDGGATWSTPISAGSQTLYKDQTVAPSTAYVYEVIASNAGDSSPASAPYSVSTLAGVPAAPTGLAGSSPSSAEIDISWTASASATGYAVQRSGDGGQTWSMPLSVGTQTSYQDKTVAAGTSYQYEVIASNGSGSSPASAPFTISSLPVAPASPTGLAGNSPSSSEIDINWSASTGATSYAVQRSSDGGVTWSTPINVGCRPRIRIRPLPPQRLINMK